MVGTGDSSTTIGTLQAMNPPHHSSQVQSDWRVLFHPDSFHIKYGRG
jgi:hypothetical protein